MKISRPFSALIASLATGYITAVLCGVCGIREWGALIVVVCVGGVTVAGVVWADDDAEVRGFTSGLRKRANPTPPLASAFRDEVPKLPDINQDPLAVEINEAARRAGLITTLMIAEQVRIGRIVEYSFEDVSIVDLPHGHPEASFKIYREERTQDNDLEPPL
jgi:hypothetical protein